MRRLTIYYVKFNILFSKLLRTKRLRLTVSPLSLKTDGGVESSGSFKQRQESLALAVIPPAISYTAPQRTRLEKRNKGE